MPLFPRRQQKSSRQDSGPLDRDQKLKLDLPFEAALRVLLETQPELETATPDKKREP